MCNSKVNKLSQSKISLTAYTWEKQKKKLFILCIYVGVAQNKIDDYYDSCFVLIMAINMKTWF